MTLLPPTTTPSESSPAQTTDAKSTTRIPRWVPVVATAGFCVGLAVPLVIMRRRQATGRLASTAPPRRTKMNRTEVLTAPTPAPSLPRAANVPASPELQTEEGGNSGLMAAKAFGIATGLVVCGALATVWGVKTVTGVQNTQEFGHQMRRFILTRMPKLSASIHRVLRPGDHPEDIAPPKPLTTDSWTWDEAEARLQEVYEKEGAVAWVQAALSEIETEGEIERARRRREMQDEPTS